MVYISGDKPIFVTLSGDLEVNETKLRNYLGGEPRLATDDELKKLKLSAGYLSPIDNEIETLLDISVDTSSDYIAGANKNNFHFTGVVPKKDFTKIIDTVDIATAKENDLTPYCNENCLDKGLKKFKGIEVGHIFKLGTAYSSKMDLNFLDSNGKLIDVEMGCYGIGVGRLLAAIIESNSSENELVFNNEIAPFQIYLASLNTDNQVVKDKSEQIYSELISADFSVLFDDRNESPGVKFNDYEFSGVPLRIVVSSRSLKNNQVEVKDIKSSDSELIDKDNLLDYLRNL